MKHDLPSEDGCRSTALYKMFFISSYKMYCLRHSGVMCADRCSANFIVFRCGFYLGRWCKTGDSIIGWHSNWWFSKNRRYSSLSLDKLLILDTDNKRTLSIQCLFINLLMVFFLNKKKVDKQKHRRISTMSEITSSLDIHLLIIINRQIE